MTTTDVTTPTTTRAHQRAFSFLEGFARARYATQVRTTYTDPVMSGDGTYVLIPGSTSVHVTARKDSWSTSWSFSFNVPDQAPGRRAAVRFIGATRYRGLLSSGPVYRNLTLSQLRSDLTCELFLAAPDRRRAW